MAKFIALALGAYAFALAVLLQNETAVWLGMIFGSILFFIGGMLALLEVMENRE
jgi:hypothetical protein